MPCARHLLSLPFLKVTPKAGRGGEGPSNVSVGPVCPHNPRHATPITTRPTVRPTLRLGPAQLSRHVSSTRSSRRWRDSNGLQCTLAQARVASIRILSSERLRLDHMITVGHMSDLRGTRPGPVQSGRGGVWLGLVVQHGGQVASTCPPVHGMYIHCVHHDLGNQYAHNLLQSPADCIMVEYRSGTLYKLAPQTEGFQLQQRPSRS